MGTYKSTGEKIELPKNTTKLHPIAEKLRNIVEGIQPQPGQPIHVFNKNLPEIKVSPALTDLVIRATHALLVEVEKHNMHIETGLNEDFPLYIQRNNDRLTLHFEEQVEVVNRQPTIEEKKKPSWTWQLKTTRFTGELSIRIDSTQGLQGRRKWTTSSSRPIELILPMILQSLENCFQYLVQSRIQEEAKERALQEQRTKEAAAAAQKRHEDKINEVKRKRTENLFRAAEWYRIHQCTLQFIDACETKWRAANKKGQLTDKQTAWIEWARTSAQNVNPFQAAYPDVEKDGEFDSSNIPLGGPYPEVKSVPEPPTFEKPQTPPSYLLYHQEESKTYPFWLQHR